METPLPGSTATPAFVSLTDMPPGFEPPGSKEATAARQEIQERIGDKQPGNQRESPGQDLLAQAAQIPHSTIPMNPPRPPQAQPSARAPQPSVEAPSQAPPRTAAHYAGFAAVEAFTIIGKTAGQRAESLDKKQPELAGAWRGLVVIMSGLAAMSRYIAKEHPYTADDVRAAFQLLARAFGDKAQSEPNYLQLLGFIEGTEPALRDAVAEITFTRLGRAAAFWSVMLAQADKDTAMIESHSLKPLVDGSYLVIAPDGSLDHISIEKVQQREENLRRAGRLRTILATELSLLCQHLALELIRRDSPPPAEQHDPGSPLAAGARAAAHPALR